jgi:RimJ/RimL family protein N-acetyltransferase
MTRTISSPMGPLLLRPERAEDADFRFRLFCQSKPEFDLLPLAGAARERFMRMQFDAQTSGYRAQFPDAEFAIIESEGECIGRSVIDRNEKELNYIELLLLPQLRSRGVGTAIIRAAIEEAQASGITMVFKVEPGNLAALRLYKRLGFIETGQAALHISMAWPPAS